VSSKTLGIYVGVDASIKHDQTAVVAVSFDPASQLTRLVFHRVYQPAPDDPLDFEHTVERTLLDLKQRFQLRKVLFDPYQMQATAQRLLKANVPVEEFPQSVPNITAASQNLFELIQSQALIAYPDAELRLAVSRDVAVESSRGWKISKATANHKIDLVVALAMAAYAAVQGLQAVRIAAAIVNPLLLSARIIASRMIANRTLQVGEIAIMHPERLAVT
jgi:phage terminase large subunit-like protein